MTGGELFDSAGRADKARPSGAGQELDAWPDGTADAPARSGERGVPDVTQRGGRQLPFDRARVATSVDRARRAAGHRDAALSQEVADIVAFTLSAGPGGEGGAAAVGVDEVGQLVERALIELGHARTAREYIVTRDRKSRARGALEGATGVGAEGGSTSVRGPLAAGPRRLLVRGTAGDEPFQVRRIVAALVAEAGIAPEDAEQVAARVAETLGRVRLRSVSTGLVRELVNNELVALGMEDALRRHEAVGVPRHDLRELFAGSRPSGGEAPAAATTSDVEREHRFEESARRALVERWALDDVLTGAAAEAHRAGDIDVIDLGRPQRVLTRSLSAALVMGRSGGGWSRVDALGLLARAGGLAVDTARGLMLEEMAGASAALVAPRGGSRSQRESGLMDYVAALGAAAQAAGRTIDFARPGGQAGAGAGRLIRALVAASSEGLPVPRLFLDLTEMLAAVTPKGAPQDVDLETLDGAEALIAAGLLVPTWSEPGQRWVAPCCSRGKGERGALAVGGAVGVNLPRLARRAGPWREDRFLEAVAGVLGSAFTAVGALGAFQLEARRSQGEAVAERVRYGLVPVGLVEALRILGDGIARADQGARVLGFLSDAAGRLGPAQGVDVRITGSYGARSARRFAAADARTGGPGQPRLFADLPRPEDDVSGSYGTGLGSLTGEGPGGLRSRVRARAESLGMLLGTVPAGSLSGPVGFAESGSARSGHGSDSAPGTPGGPVGASEADFGPEFDGREAMVAAWAERPRLAAWARFAAIRSSLDRPTSGTAQRTLF